MVDVSASLLAADQARLGEETLRAEKSGVDSIHIDVMDGHYALNFGFNPQHLRALRPYTCLPFHVHLELTHPENFIELFCSSGAKLIIVQWDTLHDPQRIFDQIHSYGAQVGLCFSPGDTLLPAQKYLKDVDMLLFLGVNPGFGGQVMQQGTLEKIAQAQEFISHMGLETVLAVDGGVNLKNAPNLIQAGANLLVIGTALFKVLSLPDVVAKIKASAERKYTKNGW
jgi:ribulose-phosphate 3-epimerase